MKAIDLYSGIGGWTLGLEMAGLNVCRCYEWWDRALDTYNSNLRPVAIKQDIRELNPSDIDIEDVDVVVGSPPCTQFSYANRGGGGDLEDGLKDVKKFLDVVRQTKPKFWAMENVPRVGHILKKEIALGGQLEEYADLVKVITVVDMSEFGLPQRRKRMIAGDFPLDILLSYRKQLPSRTLGQVISALNGENPVDPIYGVSTVLLTEMEQEIALDPEEYRLNQSAKNYHPVYNQMSFPDALDRPSRTVTALCTRVSRESIVIHESPDSENVRRLSVRERASLQGFPITYQFFGKTHAEKIKMVGNAIPPLITYYLAMAMKSVEASALPSIESVSVPVEEPKHSPKITPPNGNGRNFPISRSFRAAIKNLRFGSGMRFQLKNSKDYPFWSVQFFYGNSKDIRNLELNTNLLSGLKKLEIWKRLEAPYAKGRDRLTKLLNATDHKHLQQVWSRKGSGVGPFEVSDNLGDWANDIIATGLDREALITFVLNTLSDNSTIALGTFSRKIEANAEAVFAGLIVGSWFNTEGIKMLEPKRTAA